MKEINVELGGGECPRRKGFINVDLIENPKVDKPGVDFETDKLPFKNGSVSAIFCSHCLEHIQNVQHFLNECHRITKKGGHVKFIVPYGLHPGSQKPVHHQCITPSYFDFLRKENTLRIYGFKRWDIISLDEKINDNNEIYELSVVLTPVK